VKAQIVPMLSYEDCGRMADWLVEAFGFSETARLEWEGRVAHVDLEHGEGRLMIGRPSDAYESPRHHAEQCDRARRRQETPFVVDGVYVTGDDIEAHVERARAAGARILSEVEDNPQAEQLQYRAEDPEGHRWMLAQHYR
jgi:PhnB protein